MQEAEIVAVSLPSLGEFCWLLHQAYKLPAIMVASALRVLIDAVNVRPDQHAVGTGLAMLDAGGDVADGAISHEGRWLDGEIFMSFGQKAVRLLQDRGEIAQVPG